MKIITNNLKHKLLKNLVILNMLFAFSTISCQEAKCNVNFEHEANLYFLPSEMHDSVHVKIELAAENDEMMQGLMYRTKMNNDEGMLFIYLYEQEQYFWMKNTLIPLDLIYINKEGIVVDLKENCPTKSEENIISEELSKYVLEVNAGFCEKNFIIVGDKTKWNKISKK